MGLNPTKTDDVLHVFLTISQKNCLMITDEKISERDRFELRAKTIFANNSKNMDSRAIDNVSFCSKNENGPSDT